MYTKNETTGKDYYFDLYEKWWHYFLLCFSWFIPHKLYKLDSYPIDRVEQTEKEIEERKKLGKRNSFLVPISVLFVRMIQDIYLLNGLKKYS